MSQPIRLLGAGEALHRLRAGTLRCEELAEACLAEIAARDERLNAFAAVEPSRLLAAARTADRCPAGSRRPLHGLPLGVKDVIDTADYPTEYGCRAWRGHRPTRDALCLANITAGGALLAGKTVTTEYALREPAATRNPHDPTRSPGGSSAGSAVAVATGMTTIALGTQTNASTIRPASYCGVYGFKPSFGLIPRSGVAEIAPTLDTVGVFSRDPEGVAIGAACAAGVDPDNPEAGGHPLAGILRALGAGPTRRWRVGVVRADWDRLDPCWHPVLETFLGWLGRRATVRELTPAPGFADIHEHHMVLQDAGTAAALRDPYRRRPADFSRSLQETIERGRGIDADRITEALDSQRRMRAAIDRMLGTVDVAVTAAAVGVAPTPETTGDPIMSTPWTFSGVPALSVPQFHGPGGLPLGLQVIAPDGGDPAVLGFAAFLRAESRRDGGNSAVA